MRKILFVIFIIILVFQQTFARVQNSMTIDSTVIEAQADSMALAMSRVKLDSLIMLQETLLKRCETASNLPTTKAWVSSLFFDIDLMSDSLPTQCLLMVSILQNTKGLGNISKQAKDYSSLLSDLAISCHILDTIYQKERVNLYAEKLNRAKIWVKDDKQKNTIDSIYKLLTDYRWGTKMLLENVVEELLTARYETDKFSEQVNNIISNEAVNQDIEKIPHLQSRYEQLRFALHCQDNLYEASLVDWDFINALQTELINCRKD